MRASFRPLRKLFRREKLTNADRFAGEEEKNCTSSKDRSQFFSAKRYSRRSIEQEAGGVEQIPFEIGINAVPWKKKKKKERRGTERNPRFRGTGISIGTSARQELSNLTRSPFARYL